MRRGETWTASASASYIGKPRPIVIIQDHRFETELSITVCAFTTDETEASIFRLPIVPSADNGLLSPSVLMVDKIATIPRRKLGHRLGRLSDQDMGRLNRAIMVFLGLASG